VQGGFHLRLSLMASGVALNGHVLHRRRTTSRAYKGDNLQQNSLGGVTVALPIDRNNSVKLYANTGIVTRAGTDTDTIGSHAVPLGRRL